MMTHLSTRTSTRRPSPRATRRLAALLAALLAASAAAAAPLAADGVAIRVVDGVTTAWRSACPLEGSAAGAGALANGDFAAGLDGWTASESGGADSPGGAAAEGGAAALSEGDSFLVTLEQTFALPPDAARLSFEIALDPGFDAGDDFLPDAFEVTLLDAFGAPLVPPWSGEATSFLNFQESGAVHGGPTVEWDGTRATIALDPAAAGRVATLYFDLIGADADTASAVRFDGVVVETEIVIPDEPFLRGDANIDGGINIADPVFILNYLFNGTAQPRCLDAADGQNDNDVNISDPVYILGWLFLGTPPPPAPFPACGSDIGEDDELDCEPCSCAGAAPGGNCP